MKYDRLCVSYKLTAREAMKQLDNTAKGILFVTDDDGRLLATVTDGDIRRHILRGGDLDSPLTEFAFRNPTVASNIREAQRLYKPRSLFAIPIVDENGLLTDVYFGDGENKREYPALNIPVVINAGGKGTRLEPYTKVLPKPLIPIGDYPIIEHIMREYLGYSCDDIHVIVNYKKDVMKAYFADSDTDYGIKWHDEDKPLGTGGGLSLLRGSFDGPFFFSNCDILIKADYEGMLKFHKENGNIVTMICAYKTMAVPYGVVEMGVNGTISGMREKPEYSFLTNTGMYILDPKVFDYIEDNTPVGFPDVVDRIREAGEKVAAYPIRENDWYDMGQITELEEMRARLYGDKDE